MCQPLLSEKSRILDTNSSTPFPVELQVEVPWNANFPTRTTRVKHTHTHASHTHTHACKSHTRASHTHTHTQITHTRVTHTQSSFAHTRDTQTIKRDIGEKRQSELYKKACKISTLEQQFHTLFLYWFISLSTFFKILFQWPFQFQIINLEYVMVMNTFRNFDSHTHTHIHRLTFVKRDEKDLITKWLEHFFVKNNQITTIRHAYTHH